MKKLILFLFVALFSLGFVACKDDDNSLPIEEKIAGSYKGTLDIMMYSDGTSDGVEIAKNFPQKVYLYKVNDETIKMELKNLSVIGLDFGTIAIDEAVVIENGDSYSFTGEQELDLTDKNLGKCNVKVVGEVKNDKMILNIEVAVPAPLNQTVKVTFAGNRLTGGESTAADITAFTFAEGMGGNSAVIIQPQINGTDITFMVADTTGTETLKTLIPTIAVSEKATVMPASGVAQDFSGKVTYTVIAEDGTQQVYTVSIVQTMSYYDFESWVFHSAEATDDEGNIVPSDLDYYDPAGWATSNSALVLLKGLLSACPMDAVGVGEADGRSGKGARLVSNDSKGMYMLTVVPKVTAASLFLGEFVVDMGNTLKSTHFGVPYYNQPQTVKGYYKYKAGETYYKTEVSGSGWSTVVTGVPVPEMTDSCAITALLYEVNDYTTEWLDGVTLYDPATTNIVAIGMFTDGAEKSAFTPFEVSLNYLKAYDPAKKYKFSIICSSSKNGAEFAGAPGSELIVDDIEIINAE